MTLTITGTVPAICTDSGGGSYNDELPLSYVVQYTEGLEPVDYEDVASYGDNAVSSWTTDWTVSVGTWMDSGVAEGAYASASTSYSSHGIAAGYKYFNDWIWGSDPEGSPQARRPV